MATVYRDPRARTKINYIATAPFDVNFYNYTQSTNPNTFEVTGALSAVAGVSPTICPKGRVLRENGKRLFPGGSYPGISTFMVGVYDANSGLSGYIDPNAECFAYYNVDKPVEVVDGVDPSGNKIHRGASVYSSGNILADGNLDVGGYADISGNLTVAGRADISGNLTVGTSSVLATTNFFGTTNVQQGNFSIVTGKFNLTGSGGNASVGTATLISGAATINTTAVTSSSKIFLTYLFPLVNGGILQVRTITAGTSFLVNSSSGSDGSSFNWFIVN